MQRTVVVAGQQWDAHYGVFICSHVYRGMPVRLACFESDGDLCFMCGEEGHEADKAEIAGMIHLLEHHPEVSDLPLLQLGQWAARLDENSDWNVGNLDVEDQKEGMNP